MPKEKFEQPNKQEKAQEKPEPIFATQEELKEKQQLLQAIKQAEKDDSIEGLEKQKEILIKMEELDERRKERIANESGEGEEVYDVEKGIFTNIRFKQGKDKKIGTSYISRHAGRSLVVLLGTQGSIAEIVPNKPYKARVEMISGKGVTYVRIIE